MPFSTPSTTTLRPLTQSSPQFASSILPSSSKPATTSRQPLHAALFQRRHASTFGKRPPTRARKAMYAFLEADAAGLRENTGEPGPRYLRDSKDQPFPLNSNFRSQPVLAPELAKSMFHECIAKHRSVREVSQAFGVSMPRVAAAVRLQALEKYVIEQNQPTAIPYANSILSMLPQTERVDLHNPHEHINNLPIHRRTIHQIFYPTSDTRSFTRVDAAQAFYHDLKPADERIPHPDMIETARDAHNGLATSERAQRQRERWRVEEEARRKARAREIAREERNKTIVSGKRWDFVVRGMNAEAVAGRDGKNGAGVDGKGIGRDPSEGGIVSGKLRGMGKKRGEPWRYGVPLSDRSRNLIKIPVEVS